MNFITHLNEMSEINVEKKSWMNKVIMELVTWETLPRVIQECIDSGFYSCDLETTGLDNRVFNGSTVDRIVGVCLSPDGERGYYIPLRHRIKKAGGKYENSPHNLPKSMFRKEFTRLMKSNSVAIFHNAKFDQEFLEFNGGEAWGDWDNTSSWEDTLVLAYLENTRRKSIGLKTLSKEVLNQEMFELEDLFPEDHRGPLDFSILDPTNPKTIWYAAGDAICTYGLFTYFAPRVVRLDDPRYEKIRKKFVLPKDPCSQGLIYQIEKGCLVATRWMERNRIHTDRELIRELICIGQKEYVEAIFELYEAVSIVLGRNVMPSFFSIWKEKLVLNDPDNSIMAQMDRARLDAKRTHPDPTETIVKDKKYPYVYDVQSAQQLGQMFEEMEVPGLNFTEKSGQVKTSKDEIDKIVDDAGEGFAFMKQVKKFREVQKALSTYLFPLYEDADPSDHTIRINFNGHRVDTGRFCTPGKKKRKSDGGYLHGGTRYNLQSTPSTYDPNRPECMRRIRQCFVAPEGFVFVAADYAGVELRVVTNMSHEPLWLKEFFRCGDCGHSFDKKKLPPQFCTVCGSDKIGDLHSLSAYSFYGKDAKEREDWKKLRGDAKQCNFALCYGGGPNAVKNSISCSQAEAYRIKNLFDKTYRGLCGWWQRQHQFARENGYIQTAFGRKYPLPDINHENSFFRSKAERNATNGPVQGTSADITKIAMWRIYRRFKDLGWLDRAKMIITMHDELCFVIDKEILEEALEIIVFEMTSNKAIQSKFDKKQWFVPLVVDVEMGPSWDVPWDLNKMKKKGDWPEELKPYFKLAQEVQNRIDQGLPPVEDTTSKTVGLKKFVFTLKEKLTKDIVKKIARAIRESQSPDGKVLSIFGTNGVKLGSWERPINEDKFLSMMEE